MKKITPVFLFLVLHFSTSFAQETKSDSLIVQLKSHMENDSIKAKLLINISWYSTYENPKKSLEYANKAVVFVSEIGWNKGIVYAFRQRGAACYSSSDYLNAMEDFQNALKLCEVQNFNYLKSSILNNMANVYADMDQSEKALENYKAYLFSVKKFNKKPDIVNGLTNIGNIYSETDRMDEAIPYFEEALQIAQELKNEFYIAAILNNLGLTFKRKKNYSKALTFYERASRIASEIDNKYIGAVALCNIGNINVLEGNFSLAKINGEKALELAIIADALDWQKDSWKILSDVYEYEGNYNESLDAYKNYIRLKDSIINDEKKVEITKIEMRFQLEKQEDIANAKIEKQRLIKNYVIIGAIMLIFAIIIGYVLYKRKRDALALKKEADFKTKVAETELKALLSQMNPHFIFNSLNSISDYIDKNNITKANNYLIKFSKLIRSILENSEKKWISLEEDLELMRMYIDLESMRLKNRFSYTIKIDKAINIENTLVPPLILQPFIENSIWHGVSGIETNGKISIEIKKENELLVCIVDDNGVGRKKEKDSKKKTNSMGIKITKSRLDIINRLKKEKGSIEMFDKEKGLRVEVKLPLELQF